MKMFPTLHRRVTSPFRTLRTLRTTRLFSTTTAAASDPDLPSSDLPSSTGVAIIGGGVIGTSIAYHLSKLSIPGGVTLFEKNTLTSGTTWHAAGLMVTFGSLSHTQTSMRMYTKELYSKVLEEETGLSTGFKACGFVELATNPDRLEEYRRIAAFNRYAGVDVREIGPSEVKELCPLIETADVLGGFYVPDDGRVNPVDVTMALAKGARDNGCRIFENRGVEDVVVGRNDAGRRVVKGVRMEGVVVQADYVVNAGGMWAGQFARKHGVHVPNQANEHYYLITEKMDSVDKDWPVVEDPSSGVYIRPEGDGMMLGLFEEEGRAFQPRGIPENLPTFCEIEPDMDRMMPYFEKAMRRAPATMDVGMKKIFCGPER